MTMGNHECTGESSMLCSTNPYNTNPNYTAFMDALKPVSAKPYYRFDVTTNSGLAVFLVRRRRRLERRRSRPGSPPSSPTPTRTPSTPSSPSITPTATPTIPSSSRSTTSCAQHKYTLFLTGHSHLYRRQSSDPRAVVMGLGGAPLAGSNFNGYGTVMQGTDDRIYVSVYDQATGNVRDKFDVAPQ